MSHEQSQHPAAPTQADIEAALHEHHSLAQAVANTTPTGAARAGFNPAEFGRKAVAIAKIAAPFVAVAATTNWSNPAAAAKALVQLYDLFQSAQPSPAPAA